MHFRLSLRVPLLSLHPDGVEPLVLSLGERHDLKVTLASIETDHDVGLECVVDTEFNPSRRTVDVFEHLAAAHLPPGHLPREAWPRDFEYIDADGNIRDRYIVPMYLMPEGFQDFGRQLSGELHAAADAAIGVLRWRTRTLGALQPFASRGIEWSPDGEQWHRLPSDTSVRHADVARLEISQAAASEMQRLLDERELEPLAHVLFREAWGQRWTNPRSALLIGMTALEVGVKQYISACVPEASWLAENAPSPPVIAMLQDYLPTLQPPGGGARLQPFDGAVVETLKVAVTIRNQLSHKGADVSTDRLMPALRAVRNVLWTLDAARGHQWATDHLFPSLSHDLAVGYRPV